MEIRCVGRNSRGTCSKQHNALACLFIPLPHSFHQRKVIERIPEHVGSCACIPEIDLHIAPHGSAAGFPAYVHPIYSILSVNALFFELLSNLHAHVVPQPFTCVPLSNPYDFDALLQAMPKPGLKLGAQLSFGTSAERHVGKHYISRIKILNPVVDRYCRFLVNCNGQT